MEYKSALKKTGIFRENEQAGVKNGLFLLLRMDKDG